MDIFKNTYKYPKKYFYFVNVEGDGNCGYRCIGLQLFRSEEDHPIIRESVFNFLDINRNNYLSYNLENNGNIISSNEYIDNIKNDGEWMGK